VAHGLQSAFGTAAFRPAWFFGCVGVLLLSCALAAIGVFVGQDTPLLQFFLYDLLWTFQLVLIALYLPYDSLKRNVQNVGVGFATLAHSAIFLGVQRGGVASGYMIALLALFALVLAVLLFREKLASNVPWLRVLRRADMKQQEAEILKTAIALEQQLTCAVPLEPPSRHVNTPRSLSSSAHRYVYEQAPPEMVSDQEGQPGAPARGGISAAAEASESSLTLRLSEEFQRELAARAQAQRQSHAGEESHGEPASPSLHHRGASVGPGRLFVHRTSLQGGYPTSSSSSSSDHSNGGGGMVEPTSARPSESPRVVELAPLLPRRHSPPVDSEIASIQVALREPAAAAAATAPAAAGTQPRVRVLPPLRKLAPRAATVPSSRHDQPLQQARTTTGEHRRLAEEAINSKAPSISASATPPPCS